MSEGNTSAAVQRYLDELAGDAPAEPVIRALLDRAVRRLHQLCAALLHRGYPRLTRPPLNLQPDEMLSAVVERLLKALREARPTTVRQFFALASQHTRWELNDLARRLDEQPRAAEVIEDLVPAATVSADDLRSAWSAWSQDNNTYPGSEEQFGVNLRSVAPKAEKSRPWTTLPDGRKVRRYVYEGIGLTDEAAQAVARARRLRHR
jgi:hypothetical protein